MIALYSREITKYDETIDSREIIERIDELAAAQEEGSDFTEEDAAELALLRTLATEGESASPDWPYGATLIRDSYFTDYARELAEDIGAIQSDAGWPAYCIDWDYAARELQVDYTTVDFDGVTYWAR